MPDHLTVRDLIDCISYSSATETKFSQSLKSYFIDHKLPSKKEKSNIHQYTYCLQRQRYRTQCCSYDVTPPSKWQSWTGMPVELRCTKPTYSQFCFSANF